MLYKKISDTLVRFPNSIKAVGPTLLFIFLGIILSVVILFLRVSGICDFIDTRRYLF